MIIGISGKKRAGKDTVADILYVLHSNSVRYYFAQPLKLEVARACGVSVEYINEHKDNFRLILQGWGTNFRRELYDKNYWIKKMEVAISNLERYDNILIPDVRFKNEYVMVKSKGGIMIRVLGISQPDSHVSEIELDNEPFDYVIDNREWNLPTLIEQVKQIKI